MDALASAIVGHVVGDYLLQTDWMAQNKKLRSLPCAVHCAIWTACVCAFGGFGWAAAAFLFTTHFIQDRTQVIRWWMTLPWKNQTGFMQAPLAPWSLIIVDNSWHLVQIWVVAKFF